MTANQKESSLCLVCERDTSWGSGRFVNRVWAIAENRIGYICEECQINPKEEKEKK